MTEPKILIADPRELLETIVRLELTKLLSKAQVQDIQLSDKDITALESLARVVHKGPAQPPPVDTTDANAVAALSKLFEKDA